MTSIKTKLSIVLHIMALVPLLAFGAINYLQTSDIFTKAVQEYLFTIAKSKENALENYIDSTETVGKAIAESDVLQEYISLAGKDLTAAETARLDESREKVDHLL